MILADLWHISSTTLNQVLGIRDWFSRTFWLRFRAALGVQRPGIGGAAESAGRDAEAEAQEKEKE